MPKIQLGALCAAALFALSGTVAAASDARPADVPMCSRTVTDNCMQREGHSSMRHRHAEHREGRHHMAGKDVKRHHRAHHRAHHEKAEAKAMPAPKK